MSREQKLALILGFLAVLVVAMLISDHYSKANSDRLAAEVADSPQAIDPATPSPYSGPLAGDSGRGNVAFAPLPPTGVDASASVAGSGFLDDALRNADANRTGGDSLGTPPEPIVVTQGGVNNASSVSSDDSLLDELRRRSENLTNGIREIPAAASTTTVPIDPDRESPVGPESSRDPVDGPSGERTPVGDEPTTLSPNRPSGITPRVEERWHTVAANESLFAISKKYYGDGKHWQKLADANKNRLSGKSDLRVGVRLLIPDAATLGIGSSTPSRAKPEAKPEAKPDTKPTAKPAVKPAAPKAPASTGGRTYEVKKGDTLGAIAMRELGTTKRAGEILALNKLTNANQIRVGQKLMLPAK